MPTVGDCLFVATHHRRAEGVLSRTGAHRGWQNAVRRRCGRLTGFVVVVVFAHCEDTSRCRRCQPNTMHICKEGRVGKGGNKRKSLHCPLQRQLFPPAPPCQGCTLPSPQSLVICKRRRPTKGGMSRDNDDDDDGARLVCFAHR